MRIDSMHFRAIFAKFQANLTDRTRFCTMLAGGAEKRSCSTPVSLKDTAALERLISTDIHRDLGGHIPMSKEVKEGHSWARQSFLHGFL